MDDLTLEQMDWEICQAELSNAIKHLQECQAEFEKVLKNLAELRDNENLM